ncbi:GmrSD restriction endonuclease domain-containing protein [Solirubrobacter phytolaccae]|uniref:GmrSD restriction endonuclease domain-containing protein n=1 Tax=Solirubrobacter phytolaccae TaxID=1404360 RepID=UPI0035563ED7
MAAGRSHSPSRGSDAQRAPASVRVEIENDGAPTGPPAVRELAFGGSEGPPSARDPTERENDWYSWGGLRYLFYEYERYRTGNEDLAVAWAELQAADRPKTIEHILPQTPTAIREDAFDDEERARLTHDLASRDGRDDSNAPGTVAPTLVA